MENIFFRLGTNGGADLLRRLGGEGPCQETCSQIAHTIYEGWNFNSGNYLFTTDTK